MWSVVSKTGLCNGVEARDEWCWPMLAFSRVAVLFIVKVGAECSQSCSEWVQNDGRGGRET